MAKCQLVELSINGRSMRNALGEERQCWCLLKHGWIFNLRMAKHLMTTVLYLKGLFS